MEITGYPVYISDLFVSDNEVFVLRTRNESSIPREYDVYRVGQGGQENNLQTNPGKTAIWNKNTEKLYFCPKWKYASLIRLQDSANPIYWNAHMKKSVQ